MPNKTVSERAFEEYLSKRGLAARYEELPDGVTSPADYSLGLGGRTIRFDVKEWEPKDPLPGVGCFDPYAPVREKIEAGRKKFRQYKGRGEPCVLVLCHYGPQLIILDPLSIPGAMRGDLGWVFPFNRQTGVGDASGIQMTFLTGGRMVHHAPSGSVRLQNRTISAIAVLASIDVRARRIGIEFRRRQLALARALTIDERLALLGEICQRDQSRQVEIRVIVYDNLDAAVVLPAEFPNGPYDERIGRDGARLRRIYVGAELAAIEGEEDAVGVKRDDPLGVKAPR